ncbi:MAG: alkyl hydroperoxide reductase subunit F, partial [Pseudomonadales bacterium]|nr:alkyl hydroperoxide reductase subunit F [Pseudomonadales bacterium]
MLTNEILQALKGYAANMQKKVTFVLQSGSHDKRDELASFLSDIAGVSDNLAFEERDLGGTLRSPISFLLEADGEDTGIRFSGIPAGHEFNSLVLAFLQASGTDIKLDDSLQRMVAGAKGELNFEVFISLSCHNCPDVVQA